MFMINIRICQCNKANNIKQTFYIYVNILPFLKLMKENVSIHLEHVFDVFEERLNVIHSNVSES